MRFTLALLLALVSPAAWADPLGVFDTPEALLQAVYDQVEASQDWENFDFEAAFGEEEAFSERLSALLEAANQKAQAAGDEIGALDFSPFINGQDSGGLKFTVNTAKIKGTMATTTVDVTLMGEPHQTIGFQLVDEGDAGWKVDDILLPWGETQGMVRLSEFLADPEQF